MNAVNILVDVHCYRPAWTLKPTALAEMRIPAQYRVYIDNDLVTERTWLWSNTTFIQENSWIIVEENSIHTVTIEPIYVNPLFRAQGIFTINNLQVINQPFTSKQIDDLTISFTL
jgi:hypothetical protein